MKVIINGGRLAFANLFEPRAVNGQGEPKCNANIILDPRTQKAELDKVIAAIQQVAAEKWKDKASVVLQTLKAKGDICLQDGATKAEYDGFEGMVFISAGNKARPVVVDQFKSPLNAADGKPYSGCYCNFSIDVWAQDNQYGKRINAKLLAVQFARDGEAFSGGAGYDEADFESEGSGTSVAGGADFFGGAPAQAPAADDFFGSAPAASPNPFF